MFIRKFTQQVISTYDNPIAETKAGKLRGLISEGTYVFRGVTYATAKRFHMPEPVAKWDGIKDANVFGYTCPEMEQCSIAGDYVVRHVFYPMSEDCQSLNVFTQTMDPAAKKPVLVWLHGGGFAMGSGIAHYATDGEEMSKFGDAVVVTLNHRLNMLGYLDLAAYGEEYKNSGNAGQADLVEALKWIRDNIAVFGGDPGNVTIFGQSGGGAKVYTLMQMPAADGLYHRAIIMSGVMGERKADQTPDYSYRPSKKLAELVLKYAGIAPGDVKQLETIPYPDLVAAGKKALADMADAEGMRLGFGPVADGEYFMGSPFDVGFRKEVSDIPLMVGSVLAEFSPKVDDPRAVGSKYKWSEELKVDLVRGKFGADADKVIDAYKKAYPGRNLADVLYMDGLVRRASIAFTQMHAETCRAKTFNYLFCLELAVNDGTIPCHNCDIPYAFHNAEYLEAFYRPGISEKAQDMLCAAFVNFARTGDPNGEHVPEWACVTPDNYATMIVDEEQKCVFGHDKELSPLLPSVFPGPMRKKK